MSSDYQLYYIIFVSLGRNELSNREWNNVLDNFISSLGLGGIMKGARRRGNHNNVTVAHPVISGSEQRLMTD